MAQPVWILSVDLQAKTATFQTGLAEAAKNARGSFTDIKSGAAEMGEGINYSTMEARHSVMMLGEEFGIHLPRSLTTFIAGLGPVGPALEMAFPFLAIILGATLLIEHLAKIREAGEKVTEDQLKFGTAVQTAFNSLDDKLIQAQIKTDELSNDHLGALRLQLELIDHQSMAELVHSFEEVSKAAEIVMKDLEGHWYSVGKGSEGASHAMGDFKAQYTDLLAKGKEEAASGLLHGTLGQAQEILTALQNRSMTPTGNNAVDNAAMGRAIAAAATLEKYHVSIGESLGKQTEAQKVLVESLTAMVGAEERVAALKALEKGNATTSAGNDASAKKAAAAREAIESQLRSGELSITADKATADAQLTIRQSSLEERLALEEEYAGRERDLKAAINQGEIAALDRSGKDYASQLQVLNDKSAEIQAEYASKITELKAHNAVDIFNRDKQALEQGIREQIEGTQTGTAARLAAIDAGIREEEARGLQLTQFYRELGVQRVTVIQQMGVDAAKQTAEAGREEADSTEKMQTLQLAQVRMYFEMYNSAHRTSDNDRLQQEIALSEQEYQIQRQALEKKLDALNKTDKDYTNNLKSLQDKEKQLVQQHENDITAITTKAEEERNARILSADHRMTDDMAHGLTESIMRHQTWAQTLTNLSNQMVSQMMQTAIQSALAMDFGKEKDAAHAARKAFTKVMDALPFPADVIVAPLAAAGAFSAVMAFAGGTDSVPGVGRGDTVPTMLTPGEGVVPGGVMDGLRQVARNGGFQQGPQTMVHVRPTYHVNVIDGDGMSAALKKHSHQLQEHVERAIRKTNH